MTSAAVRVNGINLQVAEYGPADGPVVVLLHGFPELGYSWRHQTEPLAGAGYRLLVPDLRGFGGSDAPAEIESTRSTSWPATYSGYSTTPAPRAAR